MSSNKTLRMSAKSMVPVLLIFALCIFTDGKFSTKANLKLESRIVGGKPTSIMDVPWQVSVRLTTLENYHFGAGFICGGSSISNRIVITAAHCLFDYNFDPARVRNRSAFTVVMGTSSLFEANDYTLTYDLADMRYHEEFDSKTLENDIALFFLNGYIGHGYPTVGVIPLQSYPIPSPNTNCVISGWGSTSETLNISTTLMSAIVPIVSQKVCSKSYGNLSENMLCAGYIETGGIDACQGDSGGPLACNGILTGIVSWGNGCGRVGYPGVYTNVASYRNWIATTNATFDYSNPLDGSATVISISRFGFVGLILLRIWLVVK